MFLIAGYARYNCPYVWIRSNHDRLVRFSSEDTSEKDFPLQLKTTSAWKDKSKIVLLCDIENYLFFIISRYSTLGNHS